MCKEFETYMKWYQEVVAGPTEAFRKHVVTCSECQAWLLSQRDEMGLRILAISDKDLLDKMGRGEDLRGV